MHHALKAYKNDYTKEEDELLWEIHEIRHTLNETLSQKTIDQINRDALGKYNGWKARAKRKN